MRTFSVVTVHFALVSAVAALPLPASAGAQGRGERSYAQSLLRDALRRHPQIKQMELAAVRGDGCVTIAASDVGDIGDRCDERERRAMRSREPFIEDPSMVDRFYIITEALHDASGAVVGVVITDVRPERGKGREAALARARAVRRELESRIRSREQLVAGTPAASR